ncbi:stromal interaction molecule homolog [Bacillus rossius redtenbacheri]|uniref:stromal interaction molecule homolog n=1 Tax=Bacillus rossius redtenbacheri TaxID=93214 RepID=UPI002FDD72CC
MLIPRRNLLIFYILTSCLWRIGLSENENVHLQVQHEPYKPISYASGSAISRSRAALIEEQSAGIEAGLGEHCNEDVACLTQASHDRIGLEAIKSLHRQLDDDANGNIDLSESDEFLREELKYEQGYEPRQKAFHRNDDMHISVRELWEAWIRSEVHNWTVEQTSEWLATSVELPQYIPNFVTHQVTGATLPRLAVTNMYYLHNVLGIKDPIHKQKIALKAMDVVLFGPPKEYNHHVKDVVLVTLLLGALMGCWYAYRQNKSSRRHLHRMIKDMESLQKAELALDHLQKELERARLEQESVASQKENLERKLMEQGNQQISELRTSCSDLEVTQLKDEIELLRKELQRAEGELEDRCWSPPLGLQHWLQLTHELENKAYVKKKVVAEKQLQLAREACEKLRKKRSSLVGAFVSTHGKSIDDVDRSIMEARTMLNEVTQELQERVYRWKQIEMLCGFNIVNNNGLAYLENILYRGLSNGRGSIISGLKGRVSNSQDDLDDDSSSLYSPGAGWKEADSSGSETGKPEPDDEVKFVVGGDGWGDEEAGGRTQPRGSMVRCMSQDVSGALGGMESVQMKVCQSEVSLDSQRPPLARSQAAKKVSRDQRDSQPPAVDDETYSTDSNSTTDDDLRRRKRKLFASFPRKHRPKMS